MTKPLVVAAVVAGCLGSFVGGYEAAGTHLGRLAQCSLFPGQSRCWWIARRSARWCQIRSGLGALSR